MAREPGLHHELVLVDQSKLRQRQRELHASHQQSLTRLPLELLNGLPHIPAHELRVPIDPVQGARHDVLLCRIESSGRRVPSNQASLLSAPAAATLPPSFRKSPVQCDVDVIPKGSHYVSIPPIKVRLEVFS